MGNGYSLHTACPELKEVYSKCEKDNWQYFRQTGDILSNPCRDAFEDYRTCVQGVWDAKTRDYEARRRGENPTLATSSTTTATTTTAPVASVPSADQSLPQSAASPQSASESASPSKSNDAQ